MNNTDFEAFIDSTEKDTKKARKVAPRRLSFAGSIPYNELNYSPGSMGYHQAMDRVEFTIENWHSHVCSHPVFKNPDPELDKIEKHWLTRLILCLKFITHLVLCSFKGVLKSLPHRIISWEFTK